MAAPHGSRQACPARPSLDGELLPFSRRYAASNGRRTCAVTRRDSRLAAYFLPLTNRRSHHRAAASTRIRHCDRVLESLCSFGRLTRLYPLCGCFDTIGELSQPFGKLFHLFRCESAYASITVNTSHLVVEPGYGMIWKEAPGKIAPGDQIIYVIHQGDDRGILVTTGSLFHKNNCTKIL